MNAGSNTPLRIVHVLRAPVGGLFRHVCDITEGFAAAGHSIGIICDSAIANPYWEEKLKQLAPHCALGITRMPIGRLLGAGDALALPKIYSTLKKLNPDIIHGHGAKGGAYTRLIGRTLRAFSKSKKPLTFYTPHGGSLHYEKGTLRGILYHALEKILFRLSDQILFESTYARTRYGALINKKATAFPVIHNGLKPEEFESITLKDNAKDLVFVGELRELKGVSTLLQSLTKLPNVTLAIFGSGADEERFKAEATTLNLNSRVSFSPPCPVREALAHGRVAVLPSHAESMPYMVIESLAANHPIIATRVGGIPEIYGADESPLIPPEDADALATAIKLTLTNKDETQKATLRLSEIVRRDFTASLMVTRILNEYKQALNS